VGGGLKGPGLGSSIVCGCEIVTNAPSVHFMASAINKMLQQTGPTHIHTHTHAQKYVQIIWEEVPGPRYE